MNDKYYVSQENKGKVFKAVSEPYSVCGTMVVKLEEFAGCYALDGYKTVLHEAKSMGCNDIRALYRIPIKKIDELKNEDRGVEDEPN